MCICTVHCISPEVQKYPAELRLFITKAHICLHEHSAIDGSAEAEKVAKALVTATRRLTFEMAKQPSI